MNKFYEVITLIQSDKNNTKELYSSILYMNPSVVYEINYHKSDESGYTIYVMDTNDTAVFEKLDTYIYRFNTKDYNFIKTNLTPIVPELF